MFGRAPAWLLLGSLLVGGCAAPAPKAGKGSDTDAEVRKAFADFQAAVKDRSGERLYDLLDSDSRQDADRVARAVKETYATADEKKKEELAKRVGLPAAKLQDLSGKTFLESELFYRYDEHDELPDVKQLDKVDVKGDTARVDYKDPDKPDVMMHQKLTRQDGRWRVQVKVPPAPE